MRRGLAVALHAAVLAALSNLALAAPLPVALSPMHAAPGRAAGSASNQSGIRPAVLEIALPNNAHRVLVHAGDKDEQPAPAAKTVQWLTGPVPSRCQHGAATQPGTHACLVV